MQVAQSHVADNAVAAERSLDVVNPTHPDEVVAQAQAADAQIVPAATHAARDVFTAWLSTAAPARGEILRRAADLPDGGPT